MKKFLCLILAIAMVFSIIGCKSKDDPVPRDEPVDEEVVEDGTKDRHGREYVNGNIIISSEELKDMVVDFWTRWTLVDPQSLDHLYMPEKKKEALKKLFTSDDGRAFMERVLAKAEIVSDAIPEAIFPKADLDGNGNGMISLTPSGVLFRSVSYRFFLEALRAKYDTPMDNIEELLSYLDRYNTYYPGKEHVENAFQFVYIDGKPMIKGEEFLGFFDFFKEDLDPEKISPLYLVRDGYLPSGEAPQLGNLPEILSRGEYIEAYEYLRERDIIDQLVYVPKDTVKLLYGLPEGTRKAFLDTMRAFDKPLVKTYSKDGKSGALVIYYYPETYGAYASGETLESAFYMETLQDADGVMFERIIKNILGRIDVHLD